MTPFEIGLLSLAGMGAAVMLGLFVPIALIAASYLGVWAIKGSPLLASKLLALSANDSISSYFFGVVPLFVLMGFIVSEAGFGRDAFDVANALFRKLRGGLGVGTVGANAIFAAITGISIASAAVFTRIAVPQMIRHGYTPRFAVGVVAGSSVLGMLIPPSLLLILFGILSEQSIGDLFLAGVGPGLLLAVAYALGIGAVYGMVFGGVESGLGYLPNMPAVLGVPILAFMFNVGGYHLRHSHVWLRWPGNWSKVFPSPAHHHVHHSCHPDHLDKNFAFMFPLWDVLFRTYHMPEDDRDVKFGIYGMEETEYTSVWKIYSLPFRNLYRKARGRKPLAQPESPRQKQA